MQKVLELKLASYLVHENKTPNQKKTDNAKVCLRKSEEQIFFYMCADVCVCVRLCADVGVCVC